MFLRELRVERDHTICMFYVVSRFRPFDSYRIVRENRFI